MPTMFYVIVMGVLFMVLWITMQNIVYPVLMIDMFLMLFPDKFPETVQIMLLLVNSIVFGKILYDMFAPKKAQ